METLSYRRHDRETYSKCTLYLEGHCIGQAQISTVLVAEEDCTGRIRHDLCSLSE